MTHSPLLRVLLPAAGITALLVWGPRGTVDDPRTQEHVEGTVRQMQSELSGLGAEPSADRLVPVMRRAQTRASASIPGHRPGPVAVGMRTDGHTPGWIVTATLPRTADGLPSLECGTRVQFPANRAPATILCNTPPGVLFGP